MSMLSSTAPPAQSSFSADPHRTVHAQPITNVAMPHSAVAYEKLAPGGASYLPTTYLDPAAAAQMHGGYYAAQMPLQQTFPSNVPLNATYPPLGMMAAGHPAPYYPGYAAPPGYTGAAAPAAAAHEHATHEQRTPIHAPGEPTGKLPYILPDKLATPLGFAATAASQPTLGECEADGDLVTIRATGAPRWRMELQDAAWGAPIDAIVDQNFANFRLQDAESRSLKVRVCRVAPDGTFGKFTDWKEVVPKPRESEPEPEPAPPPSAAYEPEQPTAAATCPASAALPGSPVWPAPDAAAAASMAMEAQRLEAYVVRHGAVDAPDGFEAELSSTVSAAVEANEAALTMPLPSLEEEAEATHTGEYRAFVEQLGVEDLLANALGRASLEEIASMGKDELAERLGAVGLAGLVQPIMRQAAVASSGPYMG